MNTTHDRSLWPGEWCGRCDRRNIAAWAVINDLWDAVVKGRWNVLCPTCFDEEAQAAGVSYYFSEGSMLSWSDWTAVNLGTHPTLTTTSHECCDSEACRDRLPREGGAG